MIKFEKRLSRPQWLNYAVPIGSIVIGLLVGAMFLALAGSEPHYSL